MKGSNDIIGIYTITNTITGKLYVGYSDGIKTRWSRHRRDLRSKKHVNRYLQAAWDKYGESSFLFEILVECEEEHLASEENYWCNLLNVHNRKYGYNIEGTNPYRKGKASEETRKKISNCNKGKKMSPEAIKKISLAHKGKKMSELQKQNLREKNTGKKASEETKQKQSLALKGKKGITPSEEVRYKMRMAKLGIKQTPEQIENRIEKIRGKPKSEEWKKKMRVSMIGNTNGKNRAKPVTQYDILGNVIKEWGGVMEILAQDGYHHRSFTKALKEGIEYKNHIWKLKANINI